jgi:hypothetical protein
LGTVGGARPGLRKGCKALILEGRLLTDGLDLYDHVCEALKLLHFGVYAVEQEITTLREQHTSRGETLPAEVALKLRQDKSKPLLTAFKQWVDQLLPGVPPKGALGKALSYTTAQWTKISRFLEYPDMPADNNYAEQQIKNFVIGRKAWVFCDSKVGATASANLYSLVMSARAND